MTRLTLYKRKIALVLCSLLTILSFSTPVFAITKSYKTDKQLEEEILQKYYKLSKNYNKASNNEVQLKDNELDYRNADFKIDKVTYYDGRGNELKTFEGKDALKNLIEVEKEKIKKSSLSEQKVESSKGFSALSASDYSVRKVSSTNNNVYIKATNKLNSSIEEKADNVLDFAINVSGAKWHPALTVTYVIINSLFPQEWIQVDGATFTCTKNGFERTDTFEVDNIWDDGPYEPAFVTVKNNYDCTFALYEKTETLSVNKSRVLEDYIKVKGDNYGDSDSCCDLAILYHTDYQIVGYDQTTTTMNEQVVEDANKLIKEAGLEYLLK